MAKFTLEEKLSAVQRYLEGADSYASIAASIGTMKVIVSNWVLQYKHHGVEAFTKPYTSYSAKFKLD
ncbi:transposase, partial [Brevibacillus nitrificans]|uniref:transposase n=1 Tax=Brevibacillus nitrificans TaxID=651560 RepID=UPI00286D0754